MIGMSTIGATIANTTMTNKLEREHSKHSSPVTRVRSLDVVVAEDMKHFLWRADEPRYSAEAESRESNGAVEHDSRVPTSREALMSRPPNEIGCQALTSAAERVGVWGMRAGSAENPRRPSAAAALSVRSDGR
jgi:hypothetical protein